MDIVHERCCGIDVHKKMVVVCAITPESKEIRTFDTMTSVSPKDAQDLFRHTDRQNEQQHAITRLQARLSIGGQDFPLPFDGYQYDAFWQVQFSERLVCRLTL